MEKFMSCSDAWKFAEQWRNRMGKELKRAIQAHGDVYSWYDKGKGEYIDTAPYVMCGFDWGPADVKIREIRVNKQGTLEFDAVVADCGGSISICLDDIIPHHIQFIIENIKAVGEVSDVSLPSTGIPVFDDDYLNVLQELTSQAICRLQDTCDISRNGCFGMIRIWTHDFICEHKDTDWSEADFYDEIDKFIEQKIKDL